MLVNNITAQIFATISIEILIPAHRHIRTRFLVCRSIPPPFCQTNIKGPSFGWLINQVWKRVDEREKSHAANNKKGVVGSMGKKIPTTPSITQRQPIAAIKTLRLFFILHVKKIKSY